MTHQRSFDEERWRRRLVLLQGALEAALFTAEEPLSLRRLKELADAAIELDDMGDVAADVPYSVVGEALELVRSRHDVAGSAIVLVEVDGGFALRTKPSYRQVALTTLARKPLRLSRAAVETLSIIAYRQPLSRAAIDELRGVTSSGTISTLLDRDLIRVVGKMEAPGRPLLYGTSDFFLQFFGLSSLSALPPLRDVDEMSESEGSEP